MKSLPSPTPPEGAEILQAGGRGGTGNILYLFRHAEPPSVLKVYRPRRSRLREAMKDFSERMLEGKRGATAAIRCATERINTDLWLREGFEVVRRIEQPLPAGIAMPALWLAHCDGPTLWEVMADPHRPLSIKLPLAESLGVSLSRRHTRAVELHEPLLVHEHGHIKHFFVQGDRLVAFDLEHGFKPGYPVARAVARELSGVVCSLARADQAAADSLLRAFAAGYENQPLLKQAAVEANCGGGVVGWTRRWHARKSDSAFDKTRAMERLGELLAAGADRTRCG